MLRRSGIGEWAVETTARMGCFDSRVLSSSIGTKNLLLLYNPDLRNVLPEPQPDVACVCSPGSSMDSAQWSSGMIRASGG